MSASYKTLRRIPLDRAKAGPHGPVAHSSPPDGPWQPHNEGANVAAFPPLLLGALDRRLLSSTFLWQRPPTTFSIGGSGSPQQPGHRSKVREVGLFLDKDLARVQVCQEIPPLVWKSLESLGVQGGGGGSFVPAHEPMSS